MFNTKKLKLGFLIIILMSLCLVLLYFTPVSLSIYEDRATTETNLDLALYVLDVNYYTLNIQLHDLEPREEGYYYNFKVSNFTADKHSEVDLSYTLSIRTTTNMPLSYELYKNNDTTHNIITSDATIADSYGTYFRTLVAPSESFLYTENKEITYTLYVKFPETNNTSNYQNLFDYVEIIINSEQITS